MTNQSLLLGVNIDHIATVRNARGVEYPDPVAGALLAEEAGADGITLHLREDRRHIRDEDVYNLKPLLKTRMNLEMAVTDEMKKIALDVKPEHVCLVPEKREELTTEGGLDVVAHQQQVAEFCQDLGNAGIEVSLFIDPEQPQIDAARACGAPVIELHTGQYAEAESVEECDGELKRLAKAVDYARSLGLVVNAGHGLHYENVQPVAAIPGINELNIGHSIIARAVIDGLSNAVSEMKSLMLSAKG